ncbi:hypothetical protein BC939DRAFT_506219 [Gamsiella multidivaricata]|uniref:uncharacterized protein n=1 Tax=Gamsiella multidivaricata TaxID=101098 RepID=UPI00221FFB8F|nr:uncharacterized protein BC939DRAFT_506219 [Gamsiella multidivaricata]KAG0365954.1 hypothetical protein BGZ54_006002 [Gamsiella multidivaricata]KAI7818880.1 hypothetical protein BC939DRAFT_506219 [Gamsiella multidivaricata]
MQSPASSIQSPRPQGRPPAQPQVPFDKELMASLHVLLNQLNEVERQGLVMFHKIEESFKHPYSQHEAIADTANLLTQLDTLATQAKTTGFGALTMLPTSPTVVSTPSASTTFVAGTPKPSFMSPRMQNHIHSNHHHNTASSSSNNNTTNNITNVAAGSTNSSNLDIQMLSPGAPTSLVATPAGSTPLPVPSIPSTTASLSNTNTMSSTTALSPIPIFDTLMSSDSSSATALPGTIGAGATIPASTGAPAGDPASLPASVSTPMNPATPATPSATMSVIPTVALAQMMDARQKDVTALYAEKRRLKINLNIAARQSKP